MGQGQSSIDALVNQSAFAKDYPMVLACDRQLAVLLPVRLAYKASVSGGYSAGTVIARNTTSLQYEPYVAGGASGTGTAKGVLFFPVAPASGDSDMGIMIAKGVVYEAKLVGSTSGSIADLGARSVTDASAVALLMF
jgi:hypothetical protein